MLQSTYTRDRKAQYCSVNSGPLKETSGKSRALEKRHAGCRRLVIVYELVTVDEVVNDKLKQLVWMTSIGKEVDLAA